MFKAGSSPGHLPSALGAEIGCQSSSEINRPMWRHRASKCRNHNPLGQATVAPSQGKNRKTLGAMVLSCGETVSGKPHGVVVVCERTVRVRAWPRARQSGGPRTYRRRRTSVRARTCGSAAGGCGRGVCVSQYGCSRRRPVQIGSRGRSSRRGACPKGMFAVVTARPCGWAHGDAVDRMCRGGEGEVYERTAAYLLQPRHVPPFSLPIQ